MLKELKGFGVRRVLRVRSVWRSMLKELKGFGVRRVYRV
jgi:hypothetical protein